MREVIPLSAFEWQDDAGTESFNDLCKVTHFKKSEVVHKLKESKVWA